MKRGIPYFLSLSLILFTASCNEKEGDPSCGNNVSEFTGSWNISEVCNSSHHSYLLTITDSSGGIKLENFGEGGPNSVLDATLNGNSGFDILPKTIQGAIVTGNGSLNGGCEQLVIQWSGWKG